MRTDAIGIFWQDLPASKKHSERTLGPMPPIPETGWIAPRDFPNLSQAPVIGLDTETYDPHLKEFGPGWARRRHSTEKRPQGLPAYLHPLGSVVGVSVAAYGQAWYFPLRHTIQSETNLEPERVFAWLRDTLKGSQPKIGTNILYDIGWLLEEGVPVRGPLIDISFAEALLTETGLLSLEALANKYIGKGKETNLLYRWCSDWYGGRESDQRKNIWRSPPSLVGPYAEADALLPVQIFEKQKKHLSDQGLTELLDMECRMIPLLLEMRLRGVRVDLDRAEVVDKKLTARIEKAQLALDKAAGSEVNVNAAATIAPAFDRAGLRYPITPKSERPSFTKTFLESLDHPLAKSVLEVRQSLKLRDTFIRSYIVDAHVNGRVHGQFHPMRGESYGTRSGRFSSSNPNLQNIPSRDPELAPLIRSIYIPEEGSSWIRYDYSQIEYRLLLHFAIGQGAEEARQLYWEDPRTDYHAIVQRKLKEIANRELARKPTKNINFGLVYGMGEPKLARELALSMTEARALFNDYHGSVPYVKETMSAVMEYAQTTGYIQTILGRRSRFNTWGPKNRNTEGKPLPHEAAIRKYGAEIERVGIHKALNRLLQGSAADLLKKAMLLCYEEGLFVGEEIPLLTVHDELDFSARDPRAPVWGKIQQVMETVLPLRVPVKADCEIGPNWGMLQSVD